MAEDLRLLVGTQIDGTDLQKKLNAIPASQRTVTVSVKGDTTQVKTMYKDMDNLYTTTSELNSEGKLVNTTFSKMQTTFKDTGTSIKQASDHTESLIGKFTTIIKKVATFGSATAIIGLFTKAMYEAVEVVKDFDSAETDFKKVSDLTGDSLDDYTKKLGELGTAVARTRKHFMRVHIEIYA